MERIVSSPTPELMPEIVRAGAGAGKTTNLTSRVIRIAREWRDHTGQWPRLVVTTFTRKATQELRERLVLKACEHKDAALLDFVASRSRLHISTIHGVLSLFLRRYGQLMGIDPGFSIMSEVEANNMARSLLRDVLLKGETHHELLESFGFNRLVQMCRRYYQATMEEPEAEVHTRETFAQLYCEVMGEYAEQFTALQETILAETEHQKWIEYADRLKDVIEILGKSGGPESGQQVLGVFKALGAKPRYSKSNPPVSEELNTDIQEFYKLFKADMERPCYQPELWSEYLSAFKRFEKLGAQFTTEFFQRKCDSGRLQMADLELFTSKAVRDYPQVAELFSQDWDYWLIDEYQDTSPIQVKLLEHLVGDRPHYVVGDPQQSIYLFRGARSEVFSQKEAMIVENGGAQSRLPKNYRSRPELLHFFNDFFTNLSSGFSTMEPKHNECTADHTAAVFAICESSDEGDKDVFEKRAVVHRIQSLLNGGALPQNICILARTNKDLKEYAQVLGDHNIPTHVYAASGFFERREILDALALLKLLVNPHDNFNLLVVLRSPWLRVDDGELVKMVSMANKRSSYWNQWQKDFADQPTIGKLREIYDRCREDGISECFQKALVDLGFIDLSHRHDVTGRRESNLWKLVERLRQEEKQPGFNFLEFVQKNVKELSEETGNEEGDAVAALEPNCVTLMTVHASKGLQFDHVMLPRAGKRPRLSSSTGAKSPFNFDNEVGRWSFPVPVGTDGKSEVSIADRRWLMAMDKRELAEADRLLYVALTRAKESVFISWTGKAEKHSWAQRLKWNLEPGTHSRGNYCYSVETGPWEVHAARSSESHIHETPRPLFTTGAPNLRVGAKISVTALLDSVLSEDVTAAAAVNQKNLERRLRSSSEGVLVHRFMEILKHDPQFAFDKYAKDWFGDKAGDVVEAVDYVKTLERPPLFELIQNGHVEWGYQLNTRRGIVEGQIDLWGESAHGDIWLIDYKSGSSRYKERALKQLGLYSLALRARGVTGAIKLAAVYPLERHCEVMVAKDAESIKAEFEL